jgi:hypothetical protein
MNFFNNKNKKHRNFFWKKKDLVFLLTRSKLMNYQVDMWGLDKILQRGPKKLAGDYCTGDGIPAIDKE